MVANALHSQYLSLKETLAICKVIILGGLGYSFSLEAVKTLKKLMETDTREFRVLCGKDDADEVFQRLAYYCSKVCFLCIVLFNNGALN
uniref:Uncharacterized protein n=1 Tax=Cyprinus carpio TaxID=7962 RepID=A0A8C1LLM0_CYPCA